MSVPTIIIVGADKGGVGKTTVARLVLDYLRNEGLEFRAFDAETPNGVLKRFFPAQTDVTDIEHTDGQVAVFDKLERNKITVLDLAARQFSKTLTMLGDIGMLDAVKEGKLKVVVLHVIGSTVASFDEIKATAEAIKGSRYFIVTNHINDTAYFGWDTEEAHKALGLAEALLNVPKLDEKSSETVEKSGLPFLDYSKDGDSFVIKGKVRKWLSDNFKAIEPLKLVA